MTQLEGRQPVREALRAGRPLERITIARGAPVRGVLAEIVDRARAAGIRVDFVPRSTLERRAETKAHQGVIAEAATAQARSWREGLERARAQGVPPLFIALDGVTDPQNAGAIVRSAEVLGAHAVLLPRRRAAPLGAAMAKASAGALEHIVVDRVSSLERALADCRAEGLWVVSLAADGEEELHACGLLDEPVVLVVGSEERGVSHLIRTRSDRTVRITTKGAVQSLNAAAAAAICLFEAARRRP